MTPYLLSHMYGGTTLMAGGSEVERVSIWPRPSSSVIRSTEWFQRRIGGHSSNLYWGDPVHEHLRFMAESPHRVRPFPSLT